jgi:acetyl/propionyl-CoA carboxylase alpha subunit
VALARLRRALDETRVEGVVTNLPFLRWLVSHPVVRAGQATTAFLVEHPPLSQRPVAAPTRAWQGAWRLNRPSPPPQPSPTVEATGHTVTSLPGAASTLTAPMPGTVLRVLVSAGDRVQPRQALIVLEAMKMETPIAAPFEAEVRAVHVSEGQRVGRGAPLVELE